MTVGFAGMTVDFVGMKVCVVGMTVNFACNDGKAVISVYA